jgi:hypothetical protein
LVQPDAACPSLGANDRARFHLIHGVVVGGERLVTRTLSKKDLTLVILGAWTLWKHQNRCVFDGATPSMVGSLTQTEEERKVWELAGARGITYLTAQLPAS